MNTLFYQFKPKYYTRHFRLSGGFKLFGRMWCFDIEL